MTRQKLKLPQSFQINKERRKPPSKIQSCQDLELTIFIDDLQNCFKYTTQLAIRLK
jgi:hypothetical protein